MKKFLKRKLLVLLEKLAMDEMREIMKVTPEEEMSLYLFGSPDDTQKILKSAQTAQLIRHYEVEGIEKHYSKGAVTILKIILDAHRQAMKVAELNGDMKKLEAWHKYRKANRIN